MPILSLKICRTLLGSLAISYLLTKFRANGIYQQWVMLIHFPGLRERKTIAFFYYFPNPNQYLFSPPLLCIAAKMALHSSQSLSIRTALESSRSLPTLGQSHRHLSALLLLLLSRFSRVRLCATPQTAAHQASPSLGFSRQEHWSGLPFPSPMHKSEK